LQLTYNSNTINIANTFNNVTPATVAPPVGNSTSFPLSYNITANNLKNNFLYAGTYNTSMNYEFHQNTGSSPIIQTLNTNVDVVVSEMMEFAVMHTNINLKIDNAQDYLVGIDTNIYNHLKVSSTIPYDIMVKSTQNNFQNGSYSIVSNTVEIGPVDGQMDVIPNANLSIINEKIVNAANPSLDKMYNIKYKIPASKAQPLIHKPAGMYIVNVVYTLSPH
jgi:hypothetical protein